VKGLRLPRLLKGEEGKQEGGGHFVPAEEGKKKLAVIAKRRLIYYIIERGKKGKNVGRNRIQSLRQAIQLKGEPFFLTGGKIWGFGHVVEKRGGTRILGEGDHEQGKGFFP